MKSTALAIAVIALTLSLSAGEPPKWHEAAKQPVGTCLLNIWKAIFSYDQDNGRFPENLGVLIKDGFLKPEQIFTHVDRKALQSPVYYPGHSMASKPSAIILAFQQSGDPYRIIVRIDGSIGIENIDER